MLPEVCHSVVAFEPGLVHRQQRYSMVTVANIRDPSVAEPVYALLQAAYSIEAQRIGCGDFPPLGEGIEALQESGDNFLVFAEQGRILGALSYDCAGPCVTVTRLVVSPGHFRRGIASALLRALEGRLPAGTQLCASTADRNVPAICAYEKHGYATASRSVSPEGIALRSLRKRLE
jgi:ribosomal protein S18 acetylase RimI-like enzyme